MSKISPGKTFIFSNMKRTADLLKQLSQQNIQWYRKIVQYLFLATVVLIGIKFSIFVNQLASGISNNEYLFHVRNLDMPFYQHNRGEVPAYDKEAWLRMMKQIRQAGEKRNHS